MVFANLSYEDKTAFFSLLDEYFESRPHLLGQGNSSSIPGGHASIAAVQKTMAANPQATGAIVTAGLKQMPKNSPYGAVASNPKVAGGMGRVAAAAASLSASPAFPFGGGGAQNASERATSPSSPPAHSPPPTSSSKGPPPQPPVRRVPSSQSVSSASERVTGGVKGLVSQGQGMLSSFRGNDSAPGAPSPPPAPPRSPAPSAATTKSSFAPPPVRRVAPAPKKEPEPEPEPEEEEVQGEWVEALYDYTSGDAGDLNIKVGQRILVVEHSSDEWWTGELDGRKGLFPASYVKAL